MEYSTLDKALELTRKIFSNIDKSKYKYKKYELIWSIYNIIHINHSIPHFLTLEKSIVKKKNIITKVFNKVNILIKDIILFIYSIFSILYIKLFKKDVVVIWSGDFYNSQTKSDFRLGNLFEELDKTEQNFVEFIRNDRSNLVFILKNLFLRQRPVIYYKTVERILNFYKKPSVKIHLLNENVLHREILNKSMKFISNPYKIKIASFIFKFLKIKKLICWEFSDRQADLIYAAKINKIESIGFMHGAGMENYMAHEFMSEFDSSFKIGPDIMGVWSQWWKEYYLSNTKLYDQVEVSGILRKPRKLEPFISSSKEIKNVLWISEPLIDPIEVIIFMRYLNKNYNLIIKKRPSTNDVFYNNLMSNYEEFLTCETKDGDIYEAINNVDLVVGSHSTAVLDSAVLGKPFLLVNTKKWGNYFKIDKPYFVANIEEFESKISNVFKQNPREIKEQYLGKDSDNGVQWLLNHIIKGKI